MSSNDYSDSAQPLSAEQLASYERPTEVCISPDGRLIAYVVTPLSKAVSKDVEHGVSTIWMAGALDGPPRQFTGGEWADSDLCWSPDSSRLAFLSDRAERGKQSVYVMPVDGGEAVRVFDQQGKVAALKWSPDGRCLSMLFTDPETDEEKDRKEHKDDAKVWDEDPKWQRLWVLNLDAQAAQPVSPANRQVWGYCWSPDSRQLALNTTANPRINDIYGTTQLAVVSRDGTDEKTVLDWLGVTGSLVWSAASEYLAFHSTEGKTQQGEHVFTIPVNGGTPRNLTPNLDGTVYNLIGTNGGDSLAVHVVYGVNDSLQLLDWDGELRPALTGHDPFGTYSAKLDMSADGKLATIIREDGENAPDVYVIDIANQQIHRRTHMNPELEQAAIGTTEIVRWESDPGVEIEGILIKPHGYESSTRYPLVVQVHGGPTAHWGNEFYATWHDWGRYLAGRGFAVLMPNPRGSTGRGTAFMNALFDEVGGVEFRDLMSGVDAMIERGIADPDRLGVAGWSWGGYMTAWSVTQTDRFKAAVMGAGLPNMISDNGIGDIPNANLSYFSKSVYEDPDPFYERSAIKFIKNCTTPVLILHGEADDRVNMFQSVEMYVALRELGVEHQFVTYPREPHSIAERKHQIDLLTRVGEWFERL